MLSAATEVRASHTSDWHTQVRSAASSSVCTARSYNLCLSIWWAFTPGAVSAPPFFVGSADTVRSARTGSLQQHAPRGYSRLEPFLSRPSASKELRAPTWGLVTISQMVAAYSVESGDFGISSAVKRAVGNVVRLTEGRHCRQLPDRLPSRSQPPEVGGGESSGKQLAQLVAANAQV